MQSIFAWPLGKHLQSRRYLSDPFLLQRDDPCVGVGDTPAIQTLIPDWWVVRNTSENTISLMDGEKEAGKYHEYELRMYK